MNNTHFMPARSAQAPPVKIISDLDALIAQPIGFRYMNKDFVIDPITTGNFIHITKALHDMEVVLKNRDESKDVEDTKNKIYLAYYTFIHSVCKDITLEEIKLATLAQLHALMNLIIRHVKGETNQETSDLEKKKIK